MLKDKWFPASEETFVYRNRFTGSRIMILIPGGEQPKTVLIDDIEHVLDEDMTEHARMFIRVAERKRSGEDD